MSIDNLEFDENNIENIINENFDFEGTIEADKAVIIEGKIKGKIIAQDSIYIRGKGFVEADIKCKNLLNKGNIKGNINCSQDLKIYRDGNIKGNIETKELFIESGAIFNGSCKMKREDKS